MNLSNNLKINFKGCVLYRGYKDRPKAFPHSLCLIGGRDIGDYRIYSDDQKNYTLEGVTFNIKEKSIRLPYFTADQVRRLYQQHTEATGQNFTPQALDRIFEATQGQPWLVNTLGRELCFEEHAAPWEKTIDEKDVEKAIEILILRRDVHLDQLTDKLMESRVMPIIQKILLGQEVSIDQSSVLEDKRMNLIKKLFMRRKT